MKNLSGNEVRQLFLDFFASKGHMIEPSANLIPINDPSLLWINAGVAALKKYFDGRERPRTPRICNSQKCIRTNDIENVGKTARHQTFFEMLGNFSIGDYFKEDALCYAWEFLTSPAWLGFDKEKLYISVYKDDEEAYRIWTEVNGVDPSHILKSEDNYWQIGEGPCGPDSEIFYDRGEAYDPDNIGTKLFFDELENDRYIELWNVVFSQYDAKEGVDRSDFKELPQKNIDTGMGLERLVSIIQNVETNFDTDFFSPIIEKTSTFTKQAYEGEDKMAYRVIADHIRTVTFALADGASFSNEGRGYVLRRVLRRACRYGRKLNITKPFMYELVDTVININRAYYPYLSDKSDMIKKQIKKEEEMFLETLANGEKLLAEALAKVDGVLDGEVVFKLYDTYGFPKEMSIEIAGEKGISVDLEGFDKAMERQKEMARSSRSSTESMHNQSEDLLRFTAPFSFVGHSDYVCDGKVTGIFKDGKMAEVTEEVCDVVFDKTPFYAESGGQVADTGIITGNNFKAEVLDVKKAPNGEFLHHIRAIEGRLKVGDSANLEIDSERREKIRANHSSLHLLQSALIKVLGEHIKQAGSYVTDTYARFDFTHFEKVSEEDLAKIEKEVNTYIAMALPITTNIYDLEEAKELDAIALFDEKYEDKVRVVKMGDVSLEFCGGTHASNTSDLGVFKIRSEESVGSGIRRIECMTRFAAYDSFKTEENLLRQAAKALGLKSEAAILDKIASLESSVTTLRQENAQLKNSLANYRAEELLQKAITKDDAKYLFYRSDEGNLKDLASSLRGKLGNALVLVYGGSAEKVSFVVAVSPALIEKGIKAGALIKEIAKEAEGKGGGKDDIAQGGCSDPAKLETAIAKIKRDILNLNWFYRWSVTFCGVGLVY